MRQLSHLSTLQDNTTRQYGRSCICLNVLPGPHRVTRSRRVAGTHFVFMTCSSSCKRNLVEATELAKQHQVSKQRQQEGHDDSPHCNRGMHAVSPPGTPFPFTHLVAPFPFPCVPKRWGSTTFPWLEFIPLLLFFIVKKKRSYPCMCPHIRFSVAFAARTFPLQGMYPAQQVYLSMSPYSALFRRMKLEHGAQKMEKQQNLQSLQGARKRSVCQWFR